MMLEADRMETTVKMEAERALDGAVLREGPGGRWRLARRCAGEPGTGPGERAGGGAARELPLEALVRFGAGGAPPGPAENGGCGREAAAGTDQAPSPSQSDVSAELEPVPPSLGLSEPTQTPPAAGTGGGPLALQRRASVGHWKVPDPPDALGRGASGGGAEGKGAGSGGGSGSADGFPQSTPLSLCGSPGPSASSPSRLRQTTRASFPEAVPESIPESLAPPPGLGDAEAQQRQQHRRHQPDAEAEGELRRGIHPNRGEG